MGSLNSPGSINIAAKQNASWRNEGGAIASESGLAVQSGPTSQKTTTLIDPQQQNRTAASFGTNADRTLTQYSTLCISPGKKVTTSDDASLDTPAISLNMGKVAPDATSQPEIALKPVSQQSSYHTGNRLVVRNKDGGVTRNSASGFTPGP